MDYRVVITGLGVVAPNGIGKTEFEKALLTGVSGVGEVESFDTSLLKFHRGCEVKNLASSPYSEIGRASLMANIAAQQAISDSKLKSDEIKSDLMGVVIGTGLGEIQAVESIIEHIVQKGYDDVPIELLKQCNHDNISCSIAKSFGIKGVNSVVSTACSAGNDSIIYAYNQLRLNKAKIMLAGGVDPFSKIAYIGFSRLNAMSPDECKPFEKNRKGIIVGEGAGIMVLETLDNALERKAFIYGEIIGYGTSCDAYHMTGPDPTEQGGAAKAISKALKSAKIDTKDVDYICAHGTGTNINDKVETMAIKRVFGLHGYNVPVSSIKSMIGHTGGAASAIGAIACLIAINRGAIPPTINYCEPDPECDLDYVADEGRLHKINIAINNSFAFGGNNSCVVIKRYVGI